MTDLFMKISWKETSMELEAILAQEITPFLTAMKSGQEGDVYRIDLPGSEIRLVLKVWNRSSKPDVCMQYRLLEYMYGKGLAVPKAYGWGADPEHHAVLLTSYDGEPVQQVDERMLVSLADRLSDIHRLQLGSLDHLGLPRYDFIRYFFPGVNRHADIHSLLEQLVASVELQQLSVIHGDYHLGNILVAGGKYTVIDWTNVQAGDPRYDMAWSMLLVWIYGSEQLYQVYRSAIVERYPWQQSDLERFEAIASLRWIFLNRVATLPKNDDTITVVRTIVRNNTYLSEELLEGG